MPPGFRSVRLTQVDSTNDEARRQALSGAAADLLVISAQTQTQGRGRRGRSWVSPAGNLHCSFLLETGGDLARAAQVGFVAAIALADALGQLVPDASFACKWPNDILANGRKCAGMLLEPVGTHWLIAGIGVDVVAAPDDTQVMHPAICLRDLGFAGTDRDVLTELCRCLQPHLSIWRKTGFAPIRESWLERAQGVGHPITVRLETQTLTGRFAGLDGDGALLIDQPDRPLGRIMAGDVYFSSNG